MLLIIDECRLVSAVPAACLPSSSTTRIKPDVVTMAKGLGGGVCRSALSWRRIPAATS